MWLEALDSNSYHLADAPFGQEVLIIVDVVKCETLTDPHTDMQ